MSLKRRIKKLEEEARKLVPQENPDGFKKHPDEPHCLICPDGLVREGAIYPDGSIAYLFLRKGEDDNPPAFLDDMPPCKLYGSAMSEIREKVLGIS